MRLNSLFTLGIIKSEYQLIPMFQIYKMFTQNVVDSTVWLCRATKCQVEGWFVLGIYQLPYNIFPNQFLGRRCSVVELLEVLIIFCLFPLWIPSNSTKSASQFHMNMLLTIKLSFGLWKFGCAISWCAERRNSRPVCVVVLKEMLVSPPADWL